MLCQISSCHVLSRFFGCISVATQVPSAAWCQVECQKLTNTPIAAVANARIWHLHTRADDDNDGKLKVWWGWVGGEGVWQWWISNILQLRNNIFSNNFQMFTVHCSLYKYKYMISKYILASLLQIWTTGFIHLSHVDSITHSAENKGGTKKNFSVKMLYKAFIFHFPTSPLTALCWILFRFIVFTFSLAGH